MTADNTTYDFSRVPTKTESDKIKEQIRGLAFAKTPGGNPVQTDSYRLFSETQIANKLFWFRRRVELSATNAASSYRVFGDTVATVLEQFDYFLLNICNDVDSIGSGPSRRVSPIHEDEMIGGFPYFANIGATPYEQVPNTLSKAQKVSLMKSMFYNRTFTNRPDNHLMITAALPTHLISAVLFLADCLNHYIRSPLIKSFLLEPIPIVGIEKNGLTNFYLQDL